MQSRIQGRDGSGSSLERHQTDSINQYYEQGKQKGMRDEVKKDERERRK
jgi:hypothetical protein